MKELSIEEKALRYDEVVERAKIEKEESRNLGLLEFIDENFPELRESDDERIRKELINYLDNFTNNEDSELVDKFIAWLEKQGEQKHTPKHRAGDTIYYNSFGELKSMIVANVVTDSTDNPMYEDKEGNAVFEKDLIEQKSAEVRTTGYWNVQDIEQKPAEWSEEDEMMLQYAIEHFERQKRNCIEGGGRKKAMQEFIDWLKTLKDRVQPQTTWKPSEEMLEALYRAIPENVMAISEDEMLLDKLYQGLKYGKVLSEK